MEYQQYIEIVSDKRFGKPCIKGTRISVYDVLNWLSNGMSKQEILDDFNELSIEQINACLAFAADKEHKLRIAHLLKTHQESLTQFLNQQEDGILEIHGL